jgi:hypothetical protein
MINTSTVSFIASPLDRADDRGSAGSDPACGIQAGMRGFVTTATGAGGASAHSVGRVARLGRNVGQPDHVLANQIAGHKAERRPGAGEEWFAATKHDGVEVESILINKTKVG